MRVRFFADATAIFAIISLFMLFFKSVYIISDINIPKQENFKSLSQEIEESSTHSLWQLQIPKIDLVAEIAEGTSEEVLNEFIGHFENTEKALGNIGLAAHNRGYPVNYFAKLKDLKNGDEIIYIYNGKVRSYEVIKSVIIKETDWSYLNSSEENILTLITCVENQPTKRRCLQAVEKVNL